jgi:hypothetical protein
MDNTILNPEKIMSGAEVLQEQLAKYFQRRLQQECLQLFNVKNDFQEVQISFPDDQDYLQLEVRYINTELEFSNRVDLYLYMIGTAKFSETEHAFHLAKEFRERAILTQLIQDPSLNLSEIEYRENNIFVHNSRANLFFCNGNTVVLNWGQIVPNENFSSEKQIFPLGFKCIRQECDEFTETIVDCLCEIDGVVTVDSKEKILSKLSKEEQQTHLNDENAKLSPWFRITVNWNVADSNLIKVYEGKTCSQAWQGALLETLKDLKLENEIEGALLFSSHSLISFLYWHISFLFFTSQ